MKKENSLEARKEETKETSTRKYRLKPIWICAAILAVVAVSTGFDRCAGEARILPISPFMVLPFVVLLLSIALGPFINAYLWERHYPKIALGLAAFVVFYYVSILGNGARMAHMTNEYLSFIALIGSLFVVSGGIHVTVKGRSTPFVNAAILAVGALAANLLGTTGASMMLIRPFIRVNKYRLSGYHIVFFIFVVSNIGGMLTPIGDPPLFLGYLKGIPFFWVITRIWPIWIIATGLVILAFYILDRHNYRKIPVEYEHEVEAQGEQFSVTGLGNCALLAVILGSVFLPRPFRETIMFSTALTSCLTTHCDTHDKNDFNFIPLREVTILFAGIFATMTPAMDWLELNGGRLGITEPAHFYWGAGILSSFLDNAPTYLNFLSAAFGVHGLNIDNANHMKALLGILPGIQTSDVLTGTKTGVMALTVNTWKYVLAISAGSVMFGAVTYIGNGPNFMVKSIAEQNRVKMPSFFGYIIKYSIPILGPVFTLIWWLFFV